MPFRSDNLDFSDENGQENNRKIKTTWKKWFQCLIFRGICFGMRKGRVFMCLLFLTLFKNGSDCLSEDFPSWISCSPNIPNVLKFSGEIHIVVQKDSGLVSMRSLDMQVLTWNIHSLNFPRVASLNLIQNPSLPQKVTNFMKISGAI